MKLLFTLIILMFFLLHVEGQDTIYYTSFKSGNKIFSNNHKIGLADTNNKIIIPAIYENISDINCGLLKVTLNNKVGFIDVNNNLKIPFLYDLDTNNFIGNRITKTFEFDNNGELTRIIYLEGVDNNYTNFSEGFCSVLKNGKYGFIDTLGNQVIPFIFEGADNFYNKISIVKMNSKYGAINNLGKIVIPFDYDFLVVFDENRIFTMLNGKSFFLDYNGNKISNKLDD